MHDTQRPVHATVAVAAALLLTGPSSAGRPDAAQAPAAPAAAGAALERGFGDPPDGAKPRVWWHWMNGNVTKEGITQDLEWMRRVGIGGFQMFDANIGNFFAGQPGMPVHVDERVVYHSPQWKALLRHTAAEADRLGLEMTMHSAGGWSQTGGPWVQPEQAMKKVVWSETRVEGPRSFSGILPKPPEVNGPFQNVPKRDLLAVLGGKEPAPDPTFYTDWKVVAYRAPAGERSTAARRPTVTASSPDVDTAALVDGDVAKTVALPIPAEGKPAWIQLEFAEPLTARAVSIAAGAPLPFFGGGMPNGEVQASEDGKTFFTLVPLPGPSHVSAPQRTYAFPATTARVFRILLTSMPSTGLPGVGPPPAKQFDIAEIAFHESRLHRWEDKAAFGILFEYESVATPPLPEGAAVPRGDVVDLTSRMRPDGTLAWDVPAGSWVILRMGASLTGAKNGPAPEEATGFEVDKLSRVRVQKYFEDYMRPIAEAVGPLAGRSLRYILVDSWEAGLQNWTEDILAQFRQRRGYDPVPFLPALTGRAVESGGASDRFLWDYRRTIADLLVETHYATAAAFLRLRGIGLYGEAAGANNPMFQDALANKARVDIPMGEFWILLPGQGHQPSHLTDIREAASAAHVYGKPIVAAESFTSFLPGWNDPPASLKGIGDFFLAQGVNRFVIHTSVHQPFEKRRPGFTLGPFGQHFTRHNTWAEQARGWLAHLSRSSYMLQQGLFVGDLAYFIGEGAPATVFSGEKTEPEPAPPEGYAYDYINAEALLTRTSVKDGRLMLPDGMSYRVLVLPDWLRTMTPPLARKIRDLVAAGATLVGPKPVASPSLAGQPAADAEVRAIGNEVWGAVDGRTVLEHAHGRGRVYHGKPLGDVLAALKAAPDVEYTRPAPGTTLAWIHRRSDGTEIYFVSNQEAAARDVEVSFRLEGKEAELWHPETGAIGPAAYTIAGGRTTVPLQLGPHEAVFVVFRREAAARSRTLPRPATTVLTDVEGGWDVSFPAGWGAPATVKLDPLASWTTHADAGVKHFSGTATYTKTLEAPKEWFKPGTRLVLDLGTVKEIAEVSANGKPPVLVWRPPFRADLTGALQAGTNTLEVKVTNLWANRLIGDAGLPEGKRFTFTTFDPYGESFPLRELYKLGTLLESGLLGPVRMLAVTRDPPPGPSAAGGGRPGLQLNR